MKDYDRNQKKTVDQINAYDPDKIEYAYFDGEHYKKSKTSFPD